MKKYTAKEVYAAYVIVTDKLNDIKAWGKSIDEDLDIAIETKFRLHNGKLINVKLSNGNDVLKLIEKYKACDEMDLVRHWIKEDEEEDKKNAKKQFELDVDEACTKLDRVIDEFESKRHEIIDKLLGSEWTAAHENDIESSGDLRFYAQKAWEEEYDV